MEQLICKFKLPMIEKLSIVNAIVVLGYNATGNKFSVNFNGSKGYLSNIEISAEGHQKKRNNVIWVESLKTKKGHLLAKEVKIFFSDDNGVRVEVQGEKPERDYSSIEQQDEALAYSSVDFTSDKDDLPF
jgi:hypothetical protein